MSKTQRGKARTARTLSALAILVLGLGAALIGLAGTSSADVEVGELPPPVMSDAIDCEPFAGSRAKLSDWVASGDVTAWQHDSTPPSDPDGQDGETNTANLQMLGAPQTQKDVTQAHKDAVAGFWTNFQPNNTQDPFVGPPSFPNDPRGSWSEHKTEGGPQEDASGVYPNGNPDVGGNWFYRSQGTAEVPEQSHTDYRWPILERTLTPAVAPVQCVAGSDSDEQTLRDADCEAGTVTRTFQYRLEQTPGQQDWGPWQTSDTTTRDMTAAELATCDNGSDPGDPGNPGGGEVAGNAEVLGIEAKAPAAAGAAAAAPAAAPTAVDAGLGGEDQGIDPMLWLLVGGAMTIAGAALGFAPAREHGKRSW